MIHIQEKLFALQDMEYRAFNQKLIPNIPIELMIGVRVPAIRALAKELDGTAEAADFLTALPHEYFDEDMLHAALINRMKDPDAALTAVEAFLPFVDNWAVCDSLSPKVFKKRLPALYKRIPIWLCSGQTYTVRFSLGMLMTFFLDDAFTPEVLELAASVRSEEYYVRMMVAWFFATALAKQYDAAIPYLAQRKLEPWTHRKTIQKARESFRIAPEQKEYLKTLR